MKQFATYLRVSTQRQGASGLGLESQRKICGDFIKQNDGEMLQEFMDVESGTHRNRQGLANALAFCKKNNCALVIAKLDRLCRDVEFCFRVVNTGIEIHFCDMPTINTLLLGVFASVAQYERELTSDRTKKALSAKKARGEKLGGASDKWMETYRNKSEQKKAEDSRKRGETRNKHHLEKRDTQMFIKVLRDVFPDAAIGEPISWKWWQLNTKDGIRQKVLKTMLSYQEIDANLFPKWDFSDINSTKLQVKLATAIKNLRESVFCGQRGNN